MKHVPWISLFPPKQAAPYLRKIFELTSVPQKALCRISGVGFYELFINGKRIGNARLDPTFTRYDVRTGFREYDVSDALVCGENCCEIHLGHGWYAGEFADVWGFQFASYRSFPKAALRIFSGRKTLLMTGPDWEAAIGPVLDDSPRTGEVYDARHAHPENWTSAQVVPSPGGKIFQLLAPPVTLQEPIAPKDMHTEADRGICYDFGCNLTGAVQLTLCGQAGSKVTIRYGERCLPDGNFSQESINWYLRKGNFQTDSYILCGGRPQEIWLPSFSYHGFRYAKINVEGEAKILQVQAFPMRSNFARIGNFTCGSEPFQKLLEAIDRTLTSNFIGFPSDCPHREKNGWTADAHLAADSMLAFYAAAGNYAEYVDTIFDSQRPNGELPGMVPGGGYGGHWHYGPCWEAAPILLAASCYWYGGDENIIRRHYQDMRRYMEYCRNMEVDGLLNLGVGEWKLPEGVQPSSAILIDNAYYYRILQLMAFFAGLMGKTRDKDIFLRRAAKLAVQFHSLPPKTPTELGVLLDCGLGGPAEARQLYETIASNHYKAQCGIMGAKAIPRALAAYGYTDCAYQMFVQHEYPGWQWMLDHGATTLWENWRGDESQNHPMLGDAAAWAVRYLAGIQPLEAGFRKFRVSPFFPEGLSCFGWQRETPEGELACHWRKISEKQVEVAISVPPEHQGQWGLPSGKIQLLKPGNYCERFVLNTLS